MKVSRRQFLQGIIATAATGIIAPQTLIESVHGASDLTARERDAVADALGLRQKQWRGCTLDRDDALHYTFQSDGPGWRRVTVSVFEGVWPDGSPKFGQMTFELEIGESLEDAMNRSRQYSDPLPPMRAVWTDEREWIEPGAAMLFGRPIEWVSRTEIEGAIVDALNEECRRQSEEWEREFLYGAPNGQKPVGILRL